MTKPTADTAQLLSLTTFPHITPRFNNGKLSSCDNFGKRKPI